MEIVPEDIWCMKKQNLNIIYREIGKVGSCRLS